MQLLNIITIAALACHAHARVFPEPPAGHTLRGLENRIDSTGGDSRFSGDDEDDDWELDDEDVAEIKSKGGLEVEGTCSSDKGSCMFKYKHKSGKTRTTKRECNEGKGKCESDGYCGFNKGAGGGIIICYAKKPSFD
ncbi:Uu.00g001170.m01.CDS01 [Anthostomella pinea]|uniref:Uu.00g001170.m01.CDS01 n=1 Tax=Anthostomella pinea TaxID=933095 RepID=A0AAI8YIM2_9PEZI|nr:Uu.00g001170.m01.CDS01 [Anthostomella pinea]